MRRFLLGILAYVALSVAAQVTENAGLNEGWLQFDNVLNMFAALLLAWGLYIVDWRRA